LEWTKQQLTLLFCHARAIIKPVNIAPNTPSIIKRKNNIRVKNDISKKSKTPNPFFTNLAE
jgi:hypothetical protein